MPPAFYSVAATTEDNTGKNIRDSFFLSASPFSYGAGHVQPNRVADPGLVYDMTVVDYLNFLCARGYNSRQVATFAGKPFSCPRNPPRIVDLNYPSITVPQLSGRTTVTRRVKNVGYPGTYKAQVRRPRGVSVTVIPNTIAFTRIGEEKAFTVTVKAERGVSRGYANGLLTWSDGHHHVTSPLVIGIV